MKIYRAFGFVFDGYVEVELNTVGNTEKQDKERAQEILEKTLPKMFGSYALGDGVTVNISGRNCLTHDHKYDDILFEAKIAQNDKKAPMGKYRKIEPV